MQYFFDTSALVKLYHREAGTEAVLPLYKGSAAIVISELSKVEFFSTIHKKLRTGEISIDALEGLSSRGKSQHLFSLDALQVATFSVILDDDMTFLCADRRLASFVETMGHPVQLV